MRVIGLDEGGSGRDLVQSPASARYAAGHLLFVRDNILMAQPFDPDTLEFRGDAFPLAENVIVRPRPGPARFRRRTTACSCIRPESRTWRASSSGSSETDAPGAEIGDRGCTTR